MPGGVTDTDRGLKLLLRNLKDVAKGRALTVGVHGPEGEARHEDPGGKSNLTVLDIAVIHEYGLGFNPERSFIRDWYDSKRSEHEAKLAAIVTEVLKGTYDIDTGLGRLGALFQGEIQARISAGIPPPLSPITIAWKESSTPLINTGQLRSSILWKVTREDK